MKLHHEPGRSSDYRLPWIRFCQVHSSWHRKITLTQNSKGKSFFLSTWRQYMLHGTLTVFPERQPHCWLCCTPHLPSWLYSCKLIFWLYSPCTQQLSHTTQAKQAESRHFFLEKSSQWHISLSIMPNCPFRCYARWPFGVFTELQPRMR